MTELVKQRHQKASDPEPDVWWGDDGIDALVWADGQPYDFPTTKSEARP